MEHHVAWGCVCTYDTLALGQQRVQTAFNVDHILQGPYPRRT